MLLEEPQRPQHLINLGRNVNSMQSPTSKAAEFLAAAKEKRKSPGSPQATGAGRRRGSARFVAEVSSDGMESALAAIKQSLLSGGNWAQLISRVIAPPLPSVAAAASRCDKVPFCSFYFLIILFSPLFFCLEGEEEAFRTMSGGERSHFVKGDSVKEHRRALTANAPTAKWLLEVFLTGQRAV